jgi:hypothetical protein
VDYEQEMFSSVFQLIVKDTNKTILDTYLLLMTGSSV